MVAEKHQAQGNECIESLDFDALVVGAGFAGLYSLYRLRKLGYSVQVLEKADEVGGTWYYNRYPGCRCDTESHVYQYSFSDKLLNNWEYSERYPRQDEILEYLNFAADELDLRKDIQFDTEVEAAEFDENEGTWTVRTADGATQTTRHLIMAVGPLSKPFVPDFDRLDSYEGELLHTARWPHEPVDLENKSVAVIGTGSTGVQVTPEIVDEVDHLTVYQRTPNYIVPARNRPMSSGEWEEIRENYDEIWERAWNSASGHPHENVYNDGEGLSDEEIQSVLEEKWQEGGFRFFLTFKRLMAHEETNRKVREFIVLKNRDRLNDPELTDKLIPDPDDYPYGAKRPPINYDNYYKTFEREDVELVDVTETPIDQFTSQGIQTTESVYEHDAIILATGFDAVTGGFTNIDITGRRGTTLQQKWIDGAQSYIGMAVDKFPNMFMISGPQSVSAISNQPVAIEQQVNWIVDTLEYLRENELEYIEAKTEAVNDWVEHANTLAEKTLYDEAASWFTGDNIPGKPRTFLLYVGGFSSFKDRCEEIAVNGYEGFRLDTFESDGTVDSQYDTVHR